MARAAKSRRRAALKIVEERAPYRPNEPRFIAAHADHRREDFIFQRTQSNALRAMEWESRLKPLKPWAPNFVANLAFSLFA